MGLRFAIERRNGAHRLPALPTFVAAVTALALASAAAVVTSNLQRTSSDPATFGVTWDLEVNSDADPAPARELLGRDERLRSAAFLITGQLDVRSGDAPARPMPVVGIEEIAGRFEPSLLAGRAPAADFEVLMTTEAAERLRASVGDTLTLRGPSGDRDVEVVGHVVLATGDGGTATGLVADLSVVDALGGLSATTELDLRPSVVLSVVDPADLDDVVADLDAVGATSNSPIEPTDVALLDEVRLVPVAVAAFIATLGALAVFHSLWVTGRRRRGELVVLRALGARPRDAAGVIRWHAVFVGVLAVAVGVPLGVAIGRNLWAEIADRRDLVPVVTVPWMVVAGLAAAAVVGAVVVLAAAPAEEARRVRPADELRRS
jgi:ABC-type lipoprotein release transport system permease subunit